MTRRTSLVVSLSRVMCVLTLFVSVTLTGCDAFTPTGGTDTTTTVTTTVPDPNTPAPIASFIGKTVGEAKKTFGEDFEFIGYKGSSSMFYSRYGMELVLAGGYYDDPADSNVLKYAVSYAVDNPILGDITRHMSYPDLVSAIGEEVELGEPYYAYSDYNDRPEYTLSFAYKGLQVTITWLDTPHNVPFAEIVVWDPSLPIVKE
ncbi:MAG: hypothetical protein IJA68_01770 [Clostridia bacterium]|nr:hypothetical protein [Clostridia bacterium]